MAAEEKWYFTKEQLANTPSRKCGCEPDKELSNRQQAANFIQDMGQRLQVTQLCINTAIVYMHRFYVYHSFTHFHRNAMATASLFLAAKVEEQPRKLEHVIKVAHVCLHREHTPTLDTKSDNYLEQAQDLVFNENVLLQTLSFDVAIDHPHTHVVRCCHMVKASKDLAQTSYFMASNSLHLTTMCLQYKPTVVACFCIHLACKWSNWEIPQSNEGKDWFSYVDKSVTFDQLETLTTEFLQIFDKCPTKLKRKIMAISATQNQIIPSQSQQTSQLFDNEPRRIPVSQRSQNPLLPTPGISSTSQLGPPPYAKVAGKPSLTIDSYKEKKEKERLEREKQVPIKEHRESSHPKPLAHPNKLHPPGVSAPSVPVSKMAPPAGQYYPNRAPVNPSRDQARRDQAHARELTKREIPQTPPTIFAPSPSNAIAGPNDNQSESIAHHTATSVNKNSTQPWPLDKLNHNELETNRHYSDKYNNLVKDNNTRHLEVKRPHSKDHRLTHVPPSEGQKPVMDDAQRLYNSKYNNRKSDGDVLKVGDRYDSSKRPSQRASFSQPGTQPPPRELGKITEFNVSNTKDETNRLVSPNKQSLQPVPGHHAKQQNRQPSPVVPNRVSSHNSQSRPPGNVPTSSSRSQPSSNPPVPSSHDSVLGNPASSSNRVQGNPNPSSSRVTQPSGSQYRPGLPPPHPNSSQNRLPVPYQSNLNPVRPRSPKQLQQTQKPPPSENIVDTKPQITVHPIIPNIKLESRNGSLHPGDDIRRPRDHRPEIMKLEPVGLRPPTDIFSSDVPKSEPQMLINEPIQIKHESELLSTPPKSNPSQRTSFGTSSLTPVSSNSSREHHRTPTKPVKHTTPPSANKKSHTEMIIAPIGPMSPEFGSPLPPLPTTPGKSVPLTPGSNSSSRSQNRNRTTSSSSEPELVPYMKKLDEMVGFENILDSKKGIKLMDKFPIPGRVPDIIQPIRDRVKEEPNRLYLNSVSKELKPPDLIRPFANQIPDTLLQTNSTDLGAVAFPVLASEPEIANSVLRSESNVSNYIDVVNIMEPEYIKTIIEPGKLLNMPSALTVVESPVKSDHHHKSKKKEKKEKHKHKEKDKDKSKDEKRKKRKHKEKDKEKSKEKQESTQSQGSAPIKITIPKEKIMNSMLETNPPLGLKIKIHKDRLKDVSSPPSISSPIISSGGLKLKISKDIIETYTTPMATKESRKRDRSAIAARTTTTPEEVKPAKSARIDSRKPSAPTTMVKQNGVRGSQHHKMESSAGGGNKGSASGSKAPH